MNLERPENMYIDKPHESNTLRFLRRCLDSDERLVEFLIDLLVRQQPVWAVDLAVEVADRKICLVYQTHGKIALDEFPADKLNEAMGRQVLAGLFAALIEADDLLIDLSMILLSPSQIIYQPETCKIYLFVVPVVRNPPSPSSVWQTFVALITSIGQAFNLSDTIKSALTSELDDQSTLTADVLINLEACLQIKSASALDVPDENVISANNTLVNNHRFFSNFKLRRTHIFWVVLHVFLLAFLSPSWLDLAVAKHIAYRLFILSFTVLLLIADALRFRLMSVLTDTITQSISSFKLSVKYAMHPAMDERLKHGFPLRDEPASGGQTVLLTPPQAAVKFGMLSEKLPGSPEEIEGLRAYILVDEFVVGRDNRLCDFTLPSTTVGRRHARIVRREGIFFITDLGSKNGTSLDGRRLNKLEDYELPDQCRLEFADLSFFFLAS